MRNTNFKRIDNEESINGNAKSSQQNKTRWVYQATKHELPPNRKQRNTSANLENREACCALFTQYLCFIHAVFLYVLEIKSCNRTWNMKSEKSCEISLHKCRYVLTYKLSSGFASVLEIAFVIKAVQKTIFFVLLKTVCCNQRDQHML